MFRSSERQNPSLVERHHKKSIIPLFPFFEGLEVEIETQNDDDDIFRH